MVSMDSLLALCLSLLCIPAYLLTSHTHPILTIVAMTRCIKQSLICPIDSEDVAALHNGESEKRCLLKKLDATLDIGRILQRLFCLLSICLLYTVLLISNVKPVMVEKLAEPSGLQVVTTPITAKQQKEQQKELLQVSLDSTEIANNGVFGKMKFPMGETEIATVGDVGNEIGDIVENSSVAKEQVLTTAEVKQLLAPIQFCSADEEYEGQEVLPVAPIYTQYANNGALLKGVAAMGGAELAIMGHVNNEIGYIIEDAASKKKELTAAQTELLRPIEFCWADEVYGENLDFPTNKAVEQAVAKKQSLTPAQVELLKPIEFSWADEEIENNSPTPPVSTEEDTRDGPKKQASTSAEMEELLKPTEFSWADEEFEDTPIISTEEMTKVKGCNGCTAWCPTRKQLDKSGLLADDGYTLHDQMGDTEVGGPLHICIERLLCLYHPREFKQQKMFRSKVEEIQLGADCLHYFRWLRRRGEAW
ncbi:hypothetical protein BGX38DRAFT_266039 [Terfezia claveryi]|nr:hypothetical protein BGX38DRAFT_266039 [Terfezia claveryi]